MSRPVGEKLVFHEHAAIARALTPRAFHLVADVQGPLELVAGEVHHGMAKAVQALEMNALGRRRVACLASPAPELMWPAPPWAQAPRSEELAEAVQSPGLRVDTSMTRTTAGVVSQSWIWPREAWSSSSALWAEASRSRSMHKVWKASRQRGFWYGWFDMPGTTPAPEEDGA